MKLSEYLAGSQSGNFFLLAGPCVVESEEVVMRTAEELVRVCSDFDVPLVFKGSYRKANRSRLDSFTGIGDIPALEILAKVRDRFGVPVVTDIHESAEAAMAADYVDMLQIPAFLCRQTDLLVAAAKTGRYVNIKKGQFLAPESMRFAVEKVREAGGEEIAVTDRGTMFGYQDLVVDFRSVPEMHEACSCPVIMDITHSLQQPNAAGGVTGGQPRLIETLGRAAIATGADGIFMETHPDPAQAKSDGANMLPLSQARTLIKHLTIIRKAINEIKDETL